VKQLLCALGIAAFLLVPSSSEAQSVMQRTPNLSGGWVGPSGTGHFNFLHRFKIIGIPEVQDRVINSPTFLFGYSFADMFLVAANYASSSRTDAARPDGENPHPNEWEGLLRIAPFRSGAGSPFDLAFTGAYNDAAASLDGELYVGLPVGRGKLLGVLRVLSNAFATDTLRAVFGAGVTLQLTDNIALAGDFVRPFDLNEGEVFGWGAALQLGIPLTPHSLSIQAANTTTSTLQGSSIGIPASVGGVGGTRWGFEFTVPITLSRYFGGGSSAVRDVTVTADTVRVPIRDFEFGIQRLTVRPGTTVVWVNEGNVPHTSTSTSGVWNSPMLARGESYSRVFSEPGEYPYLCTPHPFMTAVVVVQP
jgi:plastocyanin